MPRPRRRDLETLAPTFGQLLDEACDRFEQAWEQALTRECPPPRIEDHLSPGTADERRALLRELVSLDADFRKRIGQSPQAEDYAARFPEFQAEWLVATTGDFSPRSPSSPPGTADNLDPTLRVRCPHCGNPLQIGGRKSDEVLCPGCGSSFHLRDARQTDTVSGMQSLGKFQLLERVGLGAFGAVWRAKDEELQRIVALKVPHTGLLTAGEQLERFYREARAAAQLRHPGIVTVHEVVTLNGLPTIVCDFIQGAPLRDWLQARRPTFAETASLVAAIAEALDYAHSLGLVHRDVKPANIMLEYSPAGADGLAPNGTLPRPLLMDFGLALRAEAEVTLTHDGQIIGTPAYMCPEQASGRSHDVDRRSDVFSLGVILYEMLTGELPFRGSKAMIVMQVMHEEPRPPRRVNDKVPRDLETICLKAMAKAPAGRYASARDMAEDLRSYLKGDAIKARPVGPGERFLKWVKRRPAFAALLAVCTLGLALLLGGGGYFTARLAAERLASEQSQAFASEQEQAADKMRGLRDEAEKQRGAAVVEGERARRYRYASSMNLADRELQQGNISHVLELLSVPREEKPDLRGFEWYYLHRLTRADRHTFPTQGRALKCVAWSPDGRLAAAAGEEAAIRIWDTTTGKEAIRLPGHPGGINSLAFHPDGERLASAGADNAVRIWNITTGQEVGLLADHQGWVTSVTFSPDGKQLASASHDETIKLWDIARKQVEFTLKKHTGPVTSVAFSPDGRRLVSGGEDRLLKIWDTVKGVETFSLRGHTAAVRAVAFTRDGKRVLSASDDATVRLQAPAATTVTVFRGYTGGVLSLAVSPNGARLATTSADNQVKIFSLQTSRELYTYRGHAQRVTAVTFSPDGQRLLTASRDGSAKVWATRASPEGVILRDHESTVWGLAFSPDGQTLASGSLDNQTYLYDTATGRRRLTVTGQPLKPGAGVTRTAADLHSNGVLSVAFSPDSQRLATAAGDQTIRVWDLTTRKRAGQFLGHKHPVRTVAFHPDGKQAASASDWPEKMIRLWDTGTGKELRILEGHEGSVTSLSFSSDGRTLASASADGTVRLWDLAEGRAIQVLKGHGDGVRGVAFAPDGASLASAGQDGTLRIWEVKSGQEKLVLRGHIGAVHGVSFSPDGQRLASAGEDSFVKVWDAATGEQLLTLRGHVGALTAVAFSPDGSHLATAGTDSSVRIWDARRDSAERDNFPLLPPAKDLIAWHKREVTTAEEAKDFSALEWHLSQLLASGEEDANLRLQRGLVRLQLGQGAPAVDDLTRALEGKSDDPMALYYRGRAYLLMRDGARAAPDLSQVIAKVRAIDVTTPVRSATSYKLPNLGLLHFLRHLARAFQGQWAEADADFLEAAALSQCVVLEHTWWEKRTAFRPRLSGELPWTAGVQDCSTLLEGGESPWWIWRARGLAQLAVGEGKLAAADLIRATELKPDNWPSWWILGRTHAELGTWDAALGSCSRAIALAKNEEQPWLLRGIIQTARGRLDEAARDYSHLVAVRPKERSGWLARAWVWEKQGQYDKALADYTEVQTLPPADPLVLLRRSCVLMKLKRSAEADEDFARALRGVLTFPQPPLMGSWDSLVPLQARLLWHRVFQDYPLPSGGEEVGVWRRAHGIARAAVTSWKEATTEFSEAVRLRPTDSLSWWGFAHTSAARGQWTTALAAVTRVKGPGEGDLLVTRLRGLAHLRLGQYGPASQQLDHFLKREPHDGAVWLECGQAHEAAGRWQEAESAYTQAFQCQPKVSGILLLRAWARAHLGRADQAFADLDEAARREPNSPMPPVTRGRVHMLLGQWDQALAEFDKVLKRGTIGHDAQYYRGQLHARLGRWEEAARDLTSRTLSPGRESEARCDLALIRISLGDRVAYDTGCAALLSSTPLRPEEQIALLLTWALAPQQAGDLPPVVELAERAAAAQPESMAATFALGVIRYRSGAFREAVPLLQEALKRDEAQCGAEARVFLAMARARLGESEEANRSLELARQELGRWQAQANKKATDRILPSWQRRLTLQILCREADAVVGGRPTPLPDRPAPTPPARAIRRLPGLNANALPPFEDGSSPAVPLGFTLNFFGVNRSSIYVNSNGNVTLDKGLVTFVPFGLTNSRTLIIAPFFADVTAAADTPIRYGTALLDGRKAFAATWLDVTGFARARDRRNSFQVILIERADTGPGNFDIEFNYDTIQWETGEGRFARVGFSNGSGATGTSFELGGSATAGSLLDSGPATTALIRNRLNSEVPGRYMFYARNGVIRASPAP